MAHSVLIAGAGVGGIEALLALDELAADLVAIELLAPADTYVQRAQLVAQPFGGPEPARIELAELTAETGAHHIRDSLAAVDAGAGVATTSGGRSLRFDSLLVAVGAIAEPGITGALTFPGPPAEFARVLEQLGHRDMRRIAFAVPPGAEWSLPAYELALLTAAEVRARRLDGVEIILVTHEREPLKAAGPPAVSLVEARLAEAGVELITGARALGFEAGELELEDREAVRADAVIGLARLRGPVIEGLPSTPAGFLPIDVQMHVGGLDSVWAVGDATSHPIKQGGLAAQQAEIAAAGIATRAGARVPRRGFDPVLRATMVTGGPAEYIRARIAGGDEATTADGRALWWPAAKVAGERLSRPAQPHPGPAGSEAGRRPRHRLRVERRRLAARARRAAARSRRCRCRCGRLRRRARLAEARRAARLRHPFRPSRPTRRVASARRRGRGGRRRRPPARLAVRQRRRGALGCPAPDRVAT